MLVLMVEIDKASQKYLREMAKRNRRPLYDEAAVILETAIRQMALAERLNHQTAAAPAFSDATSK